MSGHSKWAGIKHKKALVDAKRGQAFTKVAREIAVAAREGGGDINGNFRLRLAVQKAREVNMPADNIDRAIARGAGGKDSERLEEVRYEGYGPHGVAIIVDVLTDNKNRTVAAIRNQFNRAGGSLGEANSVAWMFHQRGFISVSAGSRDPSELALEMLEYIDVGDDGDISVIDKTVEVVVPPNLYEGARRAVEEHKLKVESSGITMSPTTTVELTAPQAPPVIRLLEALEELDDVQEVFANADIPNEVME